MSTERILEIVQSLDNAHTHDKLKFLKDEGHGGFFVNTKKIEEKYKEVINSKAIKLFEIEKKKIEIEKKKNKEYTLILRKCTELIEEQSVLSLSVSQRNEIEHLVHQIALIYETRELKGLEIKFLKSYEAAIDLPLATMLKSISQQNVQQNPKSINNGAKAAGAASLTGVALVAQQWKRDEVAEDISNIADNVEDLADSGFDE